MMVVISSIAELEVNMNDYILIFGTPVHCFDDQCGKLAKAAFNPENWRVSNIVVEEGRLLKRTRVFPFSTIEMGTKEKVSIAVYEDELSEYPEYRETVIETMPPGGVPEPAIIQGSPYGIATSSPVVPMIKELIIEGVADHLELMDKDTPIEAADETVGKVRGLVVAPANGLITHLLVHRGTIFVEEFWLSTSKVDRMSTKGVFLAMTKNELDGRIEYDDERDHYWDRLPTNEPLDGDAYDPPTNLNSEEQEVHENIMTNDATLAALIAEALMNDDRTEDAVIEVIHERGVITLQGRVEDPETKRAAEEIAAEFPGVISVTNEVAVNPQ